LFKRNNLASERSNRNSSTIDLSLAADMLELDVRCIRTRGELAEAGFLPFEILGV
jgi:hypothetical protein